MHISRLSWSSFWNINIESQNYTYIFFLSLYREYLLVAFSLHFRLVLNRNILAYICTVYSWSNFGGDWADFCCIISHCKPLLPRNLSQNLGEQAKNILEIFEKNIYMNIFCWQLCVIEYEVFWSVHKIYRYIYIFARINILKFAQKSLSFFLKIDL